MGAEYAFQELQKIQERDNTKRIAAQEKGITLVIVPCWWDGAKEK